MDRCKLAVFSLIGLGLFVMLYCALLLISMRMALPPWSLQTEGKYVAYGLSVWLYGLWMIPIGAIITLLGIYLYPTSSLSRKSCIIPTVLGLGASAALLYYGSSIISNLITYPPLPTPLQIFGGFVGMFLPLTIVLLLSIFTARKILRTMHSPK